MTAETSAALRARVAALGVQIAERPESWHEEFCSEGSWALVVCRYTDSVERALETILDVVESPRRPAVDVETAGQRLAALAVAQRYADVDGGPELVFSASNPDRESRAALAHWLSEILDALVAEAERATRAAISESILRVASEGQLAPGLARALVSLSSSIRSAKI